MYLNYKIIIKKNKKNSRKKFKTEILLENEKRCLTCETIQCIFNFKNDENLIFKTCNNCRNYKLNYYTNNFKSNSNKRHIDRDNFKKSLFKIQPHEKGCLN